MRAGNGQKDLFTDAPIWYEGLTNRQRMFVEYYCTDRACFLNATAAFIKAYTKQGKELSESSIQSNPSRLLRDSKIKEAVIKLLESKQAKDDHLNGYRLLDILSTLAFYNPGDIVDEYGNIRGSLEELGDLAVCVAGIKRSRHGREIKLFDRTKAIELLSRYLDVIRPADGAVTVSPVVYLSDKDVTQMKDEEGKSIPQAEAEDAQYEVVGA